MKHQKLYEQIVDSLSTASVDSRLKVGALLLKEGRIVATGYNGQISGQPNAPIMKDGHDISTVHAEQNIIAFAAKNGINTQGCELFVTHTPCQACTKLLIQSGITKIRFLNPYRNDENPFLDLIDIKQIDTIEPINLTKQQELGKY